MVIILDLLTVNLEKSINAWRSDTFLSRYISITRTPICKMASMWQNESVMDEIRPQYINKHDSLVWILGLWLTARCHSDYRRLFHPELNYTLQRLTSPVNCQLSTWGNYLLFSILCPCSTCNTPRKLIFEKDYKRRFWKHVWSFRGGASNEQLWAETGKTPCII